MAQEQDPWKQNNPNYRPIGNPRPLTENPAIGPNWDPNTYVEYDTENPTGKPSHAPQGAPGGYPTKIPKDK